MVPHPEKHSPPRSTCPRKKELVDREVNQQGKEQGTERKQRREIPYGKESARTADEER